jgi:chromate transporter
VSLLVVIIPWVRRHNSAQLFINGVTIASLGLMGGVLVQLVDTALVDALTIAIAVVSLVVLLASKINTTWLVGVGVVVGVLHHLAS